MPIALFSWSVTAAVLPSGETARYSGSKSVDGILSGKIRTPSSRNSSVLASNSAKPTSVEVLSRPGVATSTIETEPAGSPPSLGSPSFAVSTVAPSGLKVTWSGPTPTSAPPWKLPSVS